MVSQRTATRDAASAAIFATPWRLAPGGALCLRTELVKAVASGSVPPEPAPMLVRCHALMDRYVKCRALSGRASGGWCSFASEHHPAIGFQQLGGGEKVLLAEALRNRAVVDVK